jgi:hypothetical protein
VPEFRCPNLLGTSAYRHALELALCKSQERIDVVSAFASQGGVDWLLQHVPARIQGPRILVRWSAADLISGFGNLDIYPALVDRGFRLSMNPSVHAKLVLVDGTQLFVGSANLTSTGMGLGCAKWNVEFGNVCVATPGDVDVVESAFSDAVEVTPDLWAALKAWIAQQEVRAPLSAAFPSMIEALFGDRVAGLWVADLPWCSPAEVRDHPDGDAVAHDRALLGVGGSPDDVGSVEGLLCYRWLLACLRDAPNHELYFGELTAILHGALLDDPRPYRSDV